MDKIAVSDFRGLDAFWGVELYSMHFEVRDLSLRFELRWTDSGTERFAKLTFTSVSSISLISTSLKPAELTELISIAAEAHDCIQVSCEMSNFELDFRCAAIFVDAKVQE